MTSPRYALLTGVVFLLIAILHLWRILAGWTATIDGWPVPVWWSIIALAIAGSLAMEGFRHGRRMS